MKLLAFPDQIQLNPRDFENFRFVRDFTSIENRLEIQTDRLILVNEDYRRVYQWIYHEQGRFEGVECNAVDDLGNVYPHFLNLRRVTFTSNEVAVDLTIRKGHEHFIESARGLTFEYLYSVQPFPLFEVDYLIVPNDLNLQRIVALTLQISIIYQLTQSTLNAAKVVADAANPFTAPNAVLKAIAVAIQIAALVIQLTVASARIKELYIPKLRKMKAVPDYVLIQRGCQYLGYTLDSQALWMLRFICTVSKPRINPSQSIFQLYFDQLGDNHNTGFPTLMDSCPNLLSLIECYLKTYNLRMFVNNGIVKIERRDFFIQTASMLIKPTFSDQGKRERVWEYNDEEVYLRKSLKYVSDYTDLQAVNGILKTTRYSERQTESQNPINQDLARINGSNEYVIPFELAATKTELTGIEKALSGLFGAIDGIINFFGGNSDLQQSITDRKGVMVISQQFFEQTKRIALKFTGPNSLSRVQREDYQQILSASYIQEFYHADLSVKNNNKRVEKMTIPFTLQKFIDLQTNNFVILEGIGVAEVANIVYYDRQYKADVVLYIDDTSAFNLNEIIVDVG